MTPTPSPPLVVFGTGGSGTRAAGEIMLAAGVDLGPELNKASDSRWMTRFLRIWSRRYVAESGWIQALEADPAADPLPPHPAEIVEEFRAALGRHREAATSPGSPWGWKNPPTVFVLPLLHAVTPEALTVQVVRDGRDVAYSSNQNQLAVYGELLLPEFDGAPEPVRSIALWSRVNLAALAFARRFSGDRHLLLRYEDLCRDPAAQAARLLAHLRLPATAPLRERAAALITPSPSSGRWSAAPSAEIEAVRQAGADGLREFGYE